MKLVSMLALAFFANASALDTYSTTKGDTGPVDAVLFRTHLLDPLIVHKVAEIVQSINYFPSSNATRYELTLLYDEEMLLSEQNVKSKLREFGFEPDGSGIHYLGLSLRDFTRYPAVKPLPVSKSHQQHLGYSTWWQLRGGGELSPKKHWNWRFVWCLEHDMAFTGGNWRVVLDGHLASPFKMIDFLSWNIGWVARGDKVHGGGQWNARMRHGSLNRVPYADIAVHFGPIVRFSNKFLGYMHHQSMKGDVGHSEVAPSTMCNITNWCQMSNLSEAFVGLINYKLPVEVTSKVYHALETLAPMRLFHPVRNVGSASSKESVQHIIAASNKGEYFVRDDRRVDRAANNTALCLLRNPRPLRPSYNCPIGCPHYLQRTCPTVNCM